MNTDKITIADRIHELRAAMNEIKGDFGRYWQDCPEAQVAIASIENEISRLESLAAILAKGGV